MKKIISILLIVLIIGCSEETRNIELQIIINNKIAESKTAKYPKDIQKICEPFQDICSPEKMNIAKVPIKITREDLHKSIEIEYLGNKAGDATKIKFVARELNHFFRDSSVNKTFIEEQDTSFKMEDFLNSLKDKKNYFIYSSNENLKVNGKDVYHSINELQTSISQFICESLPSKIVVVYEPNFTTNISNKPKISPTESNETAPKENTQTVSSDKTCPDCNGLGKHVNNEKNLCKNCADGKVSHKLCNGTGNIPCTGGCRNGIIILENGKESKCKKNCVNGFKKDEICRGTGKIDCAFCKGNGHIIPKDGKCITCGGTGKIKG